MCFCMGVADPMLPLHCAGDVLDVCGDFIGRAAEAAGMPLYRPLWHVSRCDLLKALWQLGIRPLITYVGPPAIAGCSLHSAHWDPHSLGSAALFSQGRALRP